MPVMLALLGNLHILELALVAAVAVMVFGKDLPHVAMRGAAQLVKLRRQLAKLWREAGLEEELRKVRRDLERESRDLERETRLEPPRFDSPPWKLSEEDSGRAAGSDEASDEPREDGDEADSSDLEPDAEPAPVPLDPLVPAASTAGLDDGNPDALDEPEGEALRQQREDELEACAEAEEDTEDTEDTRSSA